MTERTVTVIGTNLFEVAARELGNATLWSVLARANGLCDPFITDLTTLIIPQTAEFANS